MKHENQIRNQTLNSNLKIISKANLKVKTKIFKSFESFVSSMKPIKRRTDVDGVGEKEERKQTMA